MTTCAKCGAEVGDAAACPQCGQKVLSPQSGPTDWRTDTAERPAVRPPVEPAPASSAPGPARFPLYADEPVDDSAEVEESVSAHVDPRVIPPPYAATEPDHLGEEDPAGGPTWLV